MSGRVVQSRWGHLLGGAQPGVGDGVTPVGGAPAEPGLFQEPEKWGAESTCRRLASRTTPPPSPTSYTRSPHLAVAKCANPIRKQTSPNPRFMVLSSAKGLHRVVRFSKNL